MPIKFPDGNGGITLVGADFSSVRANFDRTTLEGNPIFEGTPTFTESIKAASIVADFTNSTLLGVNFSASAFSLKSGAGLSMHGDTLDVVPASTDSLGGVKVGKGLYMSSDSLNTSYMIEDEVSLRGGVYVWNKINLAQNASLYAHSGGYWNFTSSTINAGNNLHYTGNHVFNDKITLKSGLHTADSMRSDFGDYGSIKATNDTINVSHSTITGNVTFNDKINFSGQVTLQGATEFQDDIKVADSLDVDFGSGGKIFAKSNVIEVAGSTIHGNHNVNGNIYFEDKQHFLDDIVAHDGVSLLGELSGADSLNHDFGAYTSIKAKQDTLDFRNSYIRLEEATLSGLSLNSGSDYTLPTASNSIKGGVKIGNGLAMNGETLNCTISSKVILDTVPSTVEGAMWYVL